MKEQGEGATPTAEKAFLFLFSPLDSSLVLFELVQFSSIILFKFKLEEKMGTAAPLHGRLKKTTPHNRIMRRKQHHQHVRGRTQHHQRNEGKKHPPVAASR